MKCLIVVYSYHHHNTQKVAEAMADVMGAKVKSPLDTRAAELRDYDLIGFGAGIDSGMHYRELLDFADSLPDCSGKRCFIFSTSAILSDEKMAKDHSRLRSILQSKGWEIVGEFSCIGFNTNSFLKLFGGMNKNRPNEADIQSVREFASGLIRSTT